MTVHFVEKLPLLCKQQLKFPVSEEQITVTSKHWLLFLKYCAYSTQSILKKKSKTKKAYSIDILILNSTILMIFILFELVDCQECSTRLSGQNERKTKINSFTLDTPPPIYSS